MCVWNKVLPYAAVNNWFRGTPNSSDIMENGRSTVPCTYTDVLVTGCLTIGILTTALSPPADSPFGALTTRLSHHAAFSPLGSLTTGCITTFTTLNLSPMLDSFKITALKAPVLFNSHTAFICSSCLRICTALSLDYFCFHMLE